MSTPPEFPAAFRLKGRLLWDRFDVEQYKRSLMGLPLLERDPQVPITFVSAKQLTAELPYGRRTLGRRVQGRVQDDLNRTLATA
jgi:hypothetical protein